MHRALNSPGSIGKFLGIKWARQQYARSVRGSPNVESSQSITDKTSPVDENIKLSNLKYTELKYINKKKTLRVIKTKYIHFYLWVKPLNNLS